jgi:CheY-like chemotaxis protein
VARRNARLADTGVHPVVAKGTGTILVVEDDNGVREVAVQVLQRGGYIVLTANDGIEGIEVFRAQAEEIDLVVLDLIMPRLGGRDTYDRLLTIKPGLPVLFCSGYGSDTLGDSLTTEKDVELIQKPYSSDELLAKVQLLLNRVRLFTQQGLQAG